MAMSDDDLHVAHRVLRDRLVDAGLLLTTGVDGLYGRNAVFESVVRAFDDQVLAIGADDDAVLVEFPPLLPRATFDRIGYFQTFPNLAGIIYSYDGSDREHAALMQRVSSGDGDATIDAALSPTELTLVPACCYPVYPSTAGQLPAGGRVFELSAYCFRHEPSVDPMRMQAFRQREHVCVGTSEQVPAWASTHPDPASRVRTTAALAGTATGVTNRDTFLSRIAGLTPLVARKREWPTMLRISMIEPVNHAAACAP